LRKVVRAGHANRGVNAGGQGIDVHLQAAGGAARVGHGITAGIAATAAAGGQQKQQGQEGQQELPCAIDHDGSPQE